MGLNIEIGEKIDLSTLKAANVDFVSEQEEERYNWLQQRLGKFTASQFSRLMTYENKLEKFPTGAETYVMECVAEELTELSAESKYDSYEMEWGREHELEAVAKFTDVTKVKVRATGRNQEFIKYGHDTGGTPDGRIGEYSGIEVKCPKSVTHLKYLRHIHSWEELKKIKPEYYWQIVGCMLITKAKSWFFISYDPRMKDENLRLHWFKIERDDAEIEKLKTRLTMAIEEKYSIIHGIKELKI